LILHFLLLEKVFAPARTDLGLGQTRRKMRAQALSQQAGLNGRKLLRGQKGLNAAHARVSATIGILMLLLTVKELSEQLQIKPSTLYAWVAQQKVPYRKIHGLVRFDPTEIDRWIASFVHPLPFPAPRISHITTSRQVDQIIARAKRDVYTSHRGNQTDSEPDRKGGVNGAR
jgi:excisionase family DNA binding protein